MSEEEYRPTNRATSITDLLSDGREFLEWARKCGARVGGGNWVEQAVKDAETILQAPPDRKVRELQKRFTSLDLSEEAISDLVHLRYAHQHIGDQDAALLKNKLTLALKGKSSLSREKPGDTKSRDIRFELSVCARLNAIGIETRMTDPNPDLRGIWRKRVVDVECKRVQNAARVSERISEAFDQLAKLGESAHVKVVCCDVTRAIDPSIARRGQPIRGTVSAVDQALLTLGGSVMQLMTIDMADHVDAVILYWQHYAVPAAQDYTLVGVTHTLVVENPLAQRRRRRVIEKLGKKLDPKARIYESKLRQSTQPV